MHSGLGLSRLKIVTDQLHCRSAGLIGRESLMLEPQLTAAHPYLQSTHRSSSVVCSPSVCASLHTSLFSQSCRYENGEVLSLLSNDWLDDRASQALRLFQSPKTWLMQINSLLLSGVHLPMLEERLQNVGSATAIANSHYSRLC